MIDLNSLEVVNREFDLETGFFLVEFSNCKSIQCCLKDNYDYEAGKNNFQKQISRGDNGHNEGICADANQWWLDIEGKDEITLDEALEIISGECAQYSRLNNLLIEQALEAGLEVIA